MCVRACIVHVGIHCKRLYPLYRESKNKERSIHTSCDSSCSASTSHQLSCCRVPPFSQPQQSVLPLQSPSLSQSQKPILQLQSPLSQPKLPILLVQFPLPLHPSPLLLPLNLSQQHQRLGLALPPSFLVLHVLGHLYQNLQASLSLRVTRGAQVCCICVHKIVLYDVFLWHSR